MFGGIATEIKIRYSKQLLDTSFEFFNPKSMVKSVQFAISMGFVLWSAKVRTHGRLVH